jgi:hypothetical protein
MPKIFRAHRPVCAALLLAGLYFLAPQVAAQVSAQTTILEQLRGVPKTKAQIEEEERLRTATLKARRELLETKLNEAQKLPPEQRAEIECDVIEELDAWTGSKAKCQRRLLQQGYKIRWHLPIGFDGFVIMEGPQGEGYACSVSHVITDHQIPCRGLIPEK